MDGIGKVTREDYEISKLKELSLYLLQLLALYKNRGSAPEHNTYDSFDKLSEDLSHFKQNEIYSILIENYLDDNSTPLELWKDFESIYNQSPVSNKLEENQDNLLELESGQYSFRPKIENAEVKSNLALDKEKSTNTKSVFSVTEGRTSFSGSDEIDDFKFRSENKPKTQSPEQPQNEDDRVNRSNLDICLQDKQFMNDLSACIVAPKYNITFEEKALNAHHMEERKNQPHKTQINISKIHNSRDNTVIASDSSLEMKLPLFEELELIGISRKDLLENIMKNPKEKRITVKPKLLFSFPGDVCDMSAKRVLPEFAFPFDVPAYKIPNSASKINKIIYPSNPTDMKQRFFLFTFKSEDSYSRIRLAESAKLIEKYNPNRILYCLCMRTRDFLYIKGKDGFNIWKCQKVMCIITYFPFISIFQSSLVEILSFLPLNQIV